MPTSPNTPFRTKFTSTRSYSKLFCLHFVYKVERLGVVLKPYMCNPFLITSMCTRFNSLSSNSSVFILFTRWNNMNMWPWPWKTQGIVLLSVFDNPSSNGSICTLFTIFVNTMSRLRKLHLSWNWSWLMSEIMVAMDTARRDLPTH